MTENLNLDSVSVVDCQYQAPGKAGAFLIAEHGRAAFVDNNTAHAVPYLLAALEEQGLSPEHVDYLIITHVHLDHAGGTAALLEHCPNATVLAHPKAARHLIDPKRLIAGAKAVYGEEAFAQLYGEIEPVDASRVRIMEDNETVEWGARTLRFFYTPGHASHHFCIYDSGSNGVFTGDAFGLAPQKPGTDETWFVLCTTAPPDFDSAEARATVQKILATGATHAYPAHFGIHQDLRHMALMLLASLERMDVIIEEALTANVPDAELQRFCEDRVIATTEEHLRWCGVENLDAAMAWLGDDPHINAMGVAQAVRVRRI